MDGHRCTGKQAPSQARRLAYWSRLIYVICGITFVCVPGCREPAGNSGRNQNGSVATHASVPEKSPEKKSPAVVPKSIDIPTVEDDSDRWLTADRIKSGAKGGWATEIGRAHV